MKRWLLVRSKIVSMSEMPEMDKSGNPMYARPGMLTTAQMDEFTTGQRRRV
jgi:hypothetical protein